LAGRILGFVLLASVWPAAAAWAQTGPTPEPTSPPKPAVTEAAAAAPPAPAPIHDPNVVQTGCSVCSGGLLSAAAPPVNGYEAPATGGCSTCGGGCGGSGCIPGRKSCYCDCCKDCDTCVGRMLCGLYDCVCCPDPCYEPHWCALQDSAFFVESARPVTQLRLRFDSGFDLPNPDRAEFFWARERTNPNQAEPGPSDPKNPAYNCFKHGFGKGPNCIPTSLDHEDVSLYMEGGTETFSMFIETPYREVDPETSALTFQTNGPPPRPKEIQRPFSLQDTSIGGSAAPAGTTLLPAGTVPNKDIVLKNGGETLPTAGTAQTMKLPLPAGTKLPKGTPLRFDTQVNNGAVSVVPNPNANKPSPQKPQPFASPCCEVSGFSDMNLGTKSVLLDCELLLLTFQFKTYLPTGNFITGLGTGHVSLEPGLLFALKLTPDCYLQGEFAYWIPIGGDPLYEGDIFHEHFSLNKTLWCPCPGLRLVGTAELSHWDVTGGDFTSPTLIANVPNPNFMATGKGNKDMRGQPRFLKAPVAVSATTDMVSIGPGVRFYICDKLDIGVGSQIAVTEDHWEEELVRVDFRWRF
jgi:hypothetical protein